ncbi:RNA polymerase factor sigma-54 [Ureibacillus aquaedulcis]|uniref:RNA polymerase factor sigma-54 n=1 Tax=Ureibacillus aquaedulcis TaxID=3058421 RepID=A0ABT8GTA3_9BACL|nr:RNA polymerase factor sigma-54 [Ureibacillus sp. BA0131]MDN4494646.1 RNA polymerase factor sigma-54 [Ureibacillus sp. BA0131]
METSLHFVQKLENKLSLTPQVKQSLEILKYSSEELEHFIKEEANANPLIELKEHNREHLLEMARVPNSGAASFVKDEFFDPLLNVPQQEKSMETYLMEQLAVQRSITKREREIVLYLIRNLNDLGYLDCEIEETAERFCVSVEKCEELISLLQSFEPAGIGARSLRECLSLQVVRCGNAPKLTEILIQKHLEDLADGNFQLVANLYEVAKAEVEEAFSYIKQLNPRPLMEVQSGKQEYIVPDLIVEEFNGEFVIQINNANLPQISINAYYEELLLTEACVQTKTYLKTKLSDALLLMRGIEQRHETLYKVTESILQKQTAFLQKGNKALVPLRLKEIADVVGLHESTVSRTISNKYIRTPKGVFALKAFFIRGVKMQSGEVESPLFIKEKIKSIVEREDIKKPLSDQKIANFLLAEGIPIARRTVAKYREELCIPQSTKRAQKK